VNVVRFIGRGAWVSLLLLVHGSIWFAGWLALLLSLRGRAARQRWFAARLAALLVGLGATFVKVGQIMSTRPDLFPPHIIHALVKLQDDVGAFGFAHVERTLAADFGKPPDQLFATFDVLPIASASVAQVHRATLADGREVAVKVRRPRIEQIVRFDLTVMRWFAHVVAIVPSLRLLAPVESVDEFGRAIRSQIDLTIEAANNRRFHRNFAGDPDVCFPDLVPALCSTRVLTMTFVRGKKVLEAGRESKDPARLARIGFRTLLKMVFDDGFVHADLHPGNIFVTPDDKVAILDLGLTAELDEANRRAFAKFFASWAIGDGKTMAKMMSELSPSSKVADYDRFEAEVMAFTARYLGKPLGEVAVSQVAFDMMGILRRHRVRVNPTFTMCNIAIAVTEGIGKQLDPDLDLLQLALPFFGTLQARAKL
jgi:ubiquinone biosynthesis protein